MGEWESEHKKFHNLDEFILTDKYKDTSIFLSIVIPVYNEERTVRAVLETLPRNKATEIIVVDDHSTDNSLKEIKKAKHHENIHIILHKQNMGYGKAILTGINNSKGKIIITMDSDGQHQSLDLYHLIKPILNDEADITVGSRYVGSYNYRLPVFTRVGEAAIEKFILMFFRQKVSNNQGGFRAFHRRTLKIFKEIKFEDYAFTTELLLKAALSEFRIKECPIHLLDREHGHSKIILTKLLLHLLLCVGYYTIQWVNRPHVNKWMIKRMQFFHKLPIYGRYKSIDKIYPTPERVFVAA
jgi:glycosyltransferase involved in cell wall biosynthesis